MNFNEIEQMREEGLPTEDLIPDDAFSDLLEDEDEEDEEFPDEDIDEQGGFIDA